MNLVCIVSKIEKALFFKFISKVTTLRFVKAAQHKCVFMNQSHFDSGIRFFLLLIQNLSNFRSI